MATSKKGPEKKVGISYWSKDKVKCPVCKKDFEREVMRSGNGRMIAGGLTEELHRIYEPSAKFGGKKGFYQQQFNDNKKRRFCTLNGYKLIEIPYTEENLITYDYIMEKAGY